MRNITILLFLLTVFLEPSISSAHQPRITEGRQTIVLEPEISKAYYSQLTGLPDVYIIEASEPFNLYINVLVPDIPGQMKHVSAALLKDGVQIATLDGPSFEWRQFYEPFGADTYWIGPEYKARTEAGIYEIRVSCVGNDSKYALAIGELEAFDSKEVLNALTLVPELKKNFFNESPIGFIVSPLGWGMILILYILAFVVGFIYRTIVKRAAKNSTRGVHKNIGTIDRLVRLFIAFGLLIWAITTSWSPILIFFSGFALFEAIFSWCGFYAVLGKDTCPI